MNGRYRKSAALWALAGAVVSLAILSAASIGLFLMLPAIAVLVFARRDRRGWPASVVGVAATLLLVAALNRGPNSLDARPWLWTGVALAAAGIVATLAGRARR